jgi:hypothetical protein
MRIYDTIIYHLHNLKRVLLEDFDFNHTKKKKKKRKKPKPITLCNVVLNSTKF